MFDVCNLVLITSLDVGLKSFSSFERALIMYRNIQDMFD